MGAESVKEFETVSGQSFCMSAWRDGSDVGPRDGRQLRWCRPTPAEPVGVRCVGIRLPSASTGPLRRTDVCVLSPRHGSQRLVALDIPGPHLVRVSGDELGPLLCGNAVLCDSRGTSGAARPVTAVVKGFRSKWTRSVVLTRWPQFPATSTAPGRSVPHTDDCGALFVSTCGARRSRSPSSLVFNASGRVVVLSIRRIKTSAKDSVAWRCDSLTELRSGVPLAVLAASG